MGTFASWIEPRAAGVFWTPTSIWLVPTCLTSFLHIHSAFYPIYMELPACAMHTPMHLCMLPVVTCLLPLSLLDKRLPDLQESTGMLLTLSLWDALITASVLPCAHLYISRSPLQATCIFTCLSPTLNSELPKGKICLTALCPVPGTEFDMSTCPIIVDWKSRQIFTFTTNNNCKYHLESSTMRAERAAWMNMNEQSVCGLLISTQKEAKVWKMGLYLHTRKRSRESKGTR